MSQWDDMDELWPLEGSMGLLPSSGVGSREGRIRLRCKGRVHPGDFSIGYHMKLCHFLSSISSHLKQSDGEKDFCLCWKKTGQNVLIPD